MATESELQKNGGEVFNGSLDCVTVEFQLCSSGGSFKDGETQEDRFFSFIGQCELF